MNKQPDIYFPVATIKDCKILEFSIDDSDLSTCSNTALKQGFYSGLEVIDSNGFLHTIKNAATSGSQILGRLKGRVQVDLEFESNSVQLSVNEVQNRIISAIDSNIDYWEAGGNISELKDIILKSTSIETIISSLMDYYYSN